MTLLSVFALALFGIFSLSIADAEAQEPRLISVQHHNPNSSPTNENELKWKLIFSENINISSFTSGDLALDEGPQNVNLNVAHEGSSSTDWIITASGPSLDGYNGNVKLKFADDVEITWGSFLIRKVDDLIPDSDQPAEWIFVLDNTAPTISASGLGNQISNPVTVNLTFSETPTGFGASDVTASNATVSAFAGSGTAYSFRLTPDAGLASGATVRWEIAANAFTDAAGNGNERATQTSNFVPPPPSKPTGLTAISGNAQVTLKWTNPNNDTITGWQYRQKVNTSNSWGSWNDIAGSDKNTTEATVTAGLTNGTEYAFQIRAVNDTGNGAESDAATATPKAPPSSPTIVDVVPGRQSIRVTVTALADATAWQARCRTGDGAFGSWANAADAADPGNSKNRIVTISNLRNNTTYVCEVRALNGTVVGAESAETAEATPHTTPNGPGPVVLTPGDGSVVLQWSAPDNVNTSLIVRYQYKLSKANRTSWDSWQNIPDNATAAREHRVTGLVNGVIHYFVLRANTAVFKGEQSADDNRAPGTIPTVTPARPVLGEPEPGDGLVSLVWTYTANSAAVADWQQRRKESSVAEWGAWVNIGGSATTTRFTVSGLTNGRSYDFQVRARTSSGVAGEESNTRSATPAAAPAKPTGFTAEAGDRQVTLTWTGPENAHIIRYEYQQKEGSGSFGNWEKMDIIGDVAAAREYDVTGLTNGTAYTFRMRAVTVGGDGPASDASASVTPDKTPRQPSGFKLEPGNATIKLVWANQSDDEASIVKWQYQEKIGTGLWSRWNDISSSDKNTTSFERDRLTNGTAYGYRIRAVATGDKFGPASDDRFATPAGPPAAATLTATPGARRVTLSWTLAADASIERWQYQKLEGTAANAAAFANVAWTPIPGSGAATRSHTVRGLEGEVAYSFRVRAIGYGGDGAESDIATATPTPGPSVEEQRRVLKHTLAAVAQATLAGAADTIGQRFDAAPGARSLTLAGQRVGSADRSPEAEAGATGPGAAAASDPRIAGGGARDDFGRRVGNSSYGVDGDALLRGSAFTLSLAGKEAGAGGPDWTVWGRTDWRAFEGRRSGDRWDGSQWTSWLGMDGKFNRRLTAGVAVSHGESETDYRLDDEFEGRLKTTLTALWPYLQMKTAGGGAVRVVLGAGTGEAEHRAFDGTVEREDLTMLAGSVSGRMPVARRSGFTLSAIGGASLAQIETDGSSSTSLGGLTATSWRLRAGVEAEHDGFALSSGSDWQVRPRGALALRQDGGDGVTGTGMEVSAGMRLSKPGSRFGLDASGHWLALHSASGTREWGASLEARLNPAAGGRGLSLALGPSWGQQQDGALARERLFDRERHETPQRLSLTARAGYGFAAAGGLLTPFADMALGGESRTQHYRTGIGFARSGIDAALTAGHRAGGTPDTRIGMDLRLRY